MAYNYEKLYKDTPDALGDPDPVFVAFFAERVGTTLSVLDIGCGQGRDTLFIGRAGHKVTGVDISPSGIRDVNAQAAKEGLSVRGIVADVTSFEPDGMFDIVLIDRTLHMLEEHTRAQSLSRFLDRVKPDGFCLIADERRNIEGFKQIARSHVDDWNVSLDRKVFLFLQRL